MMLRNLQLALIVSLFFYNNSLSYTDTASLRDNHVQIVSDGSHSISLSFELTDVEIRTVVKDDRTFEAYGIIGEGVIVDYGKPILPAVGRFVVIPPDVNVELVVRADEPRYIPADTPPPICDDENLVALFFQGASQDDDLYPPEIATVSDPIVIRGVRLVKVMTFPIQYDAANRRYLHRERIEAELVFTGGEPINPVRVPVRRHRSKNFLKYINTLAINGDIVGRDDPEEEEEYIGHYLVAIHERCLQYAAPFIEWRRKSGYKVDILRLTSQQAGSENTVKREIQSRYDAYLNDGIDPFDLLLIVGDRHHYYYTQAANWILRSFPGNPTWGGDNHADYLFACLEGGGNDLHPDVGYSRWHTGAENLMELAVGKTLAYEAEPYMEDTDWFTKGVVYSQHWGNSATSAWHITIHTNARWCYEVLESLGFDDIEFYEDTEWDRTGERIGPEYEDWLNEGRNVFLGRAEMYYWDGTPAGSGNFERGVDENVIFPIILSHSGHAEWSAECMTRRGSGDLLRGPVANTYGWGNPRYTAPISASWIECVNGVMFQDMPLGWGRAFGITSIETYFGGAEQYILNNKTEFDSYGDPGIQPWIGVPLVVEVDYPESITPETRMIEIFVEENVEGAQVTLYSPGDMPSWSHADYAAYDDMVMFTKKTDAEGRARFIFSEPVFDYRYDLFVTVTGRNICPAFGEIEVLRDNAIIELADYTLSDEDDEESVNPGETITLELTAVNLSREDDIENVTAVVIPRSPWVQVEENEISFGEVIRAGETVEGEGEVTLHIAEACPDGASRPSTRPDLEVEFSGNNRSWSSGIRLNPEAPNFEIHGFPDGNIVPDSLYELDIDLANIGSMSANDVSARLFTRGMGVGVVRAEASFRDINAGEHSRISGDRFLVSGNPIVPPGFRNPMMMIVGSDNGFIDTVYFELQVEEPRTGAPSPPDPYGYMCFDDTDEGWDISPEYEWIEINPQEEYNFRGTRLDFDGQTPHNIGESAVIDLGFRTRFYGHDYYEITICTNGFIGPGDQELVTNHQNWPLDRAIGGGVGMIAPFWDDLRFGGDESGVFYYYDEDDSRMIVEWSDMRQRTGDNNDLTFQVIIHDADVWAVDVGGNPCIVFQYASVSNSQNIRQGDQAWVTGIPFASVGISSPDGDSGINYTFYNLYPPWAARLENHRAMLFTTTPQFRSGCIEGWVTDEETGQPVPDAIVTTSVGGAATTDEEGYYFITDALAVVRFDITASRQGYNDSTLVDTILVENDTMEISFSLLHPEFLSSTGFIWTRLDTELTTVIPFNIRNDGNGPLDWSVYRRLPGGAERDPWELRLSYPIGQTVGDSRIEGLVYIDSLFYVVGANRLGRVDSTNMIYILNHDGEPLDSVYQPGESLYGMKDLAWDGELIWGSGEYTVFGMNREGEVEDSFEGPYSNNNVLTWDSDREILWVGSMVQSGIIGYNRQHEEVTSLDRHGLRLYGLAYWPDEPDGYSLYIFHSPGSGRQVVHKMNPDTGDTVFVRELEPDEGGSPCGAFITNQFDVYSWVFMTIANDGADDRIDLWQLDARRDWFKLFTEEDTVQVEMERGRIDVGESRDFEARMSSADLVIGTYLGMFEFNHNAGDGQTVIDVRLDVIGPEPSTEFNLVQPEDNETLDANTDTTVVTFTWERSIDYNRGDEVSYLIWFESVGVTFRRMSIDTAFTADISYIADSLGLSIERPFPMIWGVKAVSADDTTDCIRPFSFRFEPNYIIAEGRLPVEFGLHSIYPSPFNAMTTVRFGVDKPERIRLKVYDLLGREVVTLLDNAMKVGYHQAVWNASAVPSGLYIMRMEAEGRIQAAKVAVIR